MLFFLQVHAENLIKVELADIPLKKNKFDEYAHHQYNIQFPLYALEPVYMQYLQEQCINRSAFKPFVQNIKENKIRQNIGFNRYVDPPVLQRPERVIPLSQIEHFEGGYQPNVALAPPAPKKHRYIKHLQHFNKEIVDAYPSNEVTSSVQKNDIKPSVIKHEKYIDLDSPRNQVIQKSPDSQSVIDSTVSVVQSTGKLARYNSEIELSTDTDDSASETSEKQSDLYKIEEVLKEINSDVKQTVISMFQRIIKEKEDNLNETREKDNKIKDLELKVAELEKRLQEYDNSKTEISSFNSSPPRERSRESTPSLQENEIKSTPTVTCDNNNEGDGQKNQVVENSSSIFYENNDDNVAQTEDNNQTSVIAIVDKQQDTAIIKNEPE